MPLIPCCALKVTLTMLMSRPMSRPTTAAAPTPSQGLARLEDGVEAEEGAHEHDAFHAEVEHAGPLRDRLADGGVEVGRGQPDALVDDAQDDGHGRQILIHEPASCAGTNCLCSGFFSTGLRICRYTACHASLYKVLRADDEEDDKAQHGNDHDLGDLHGALHLVTADEQPAEEDGRGDDAQRVQLAE
jgi:hypothetical protein